MLASGATLGAVLDHLVSAELPPPLLLVRSVRVATGLTLSETTTVLQAFRDGRRRFDHVRAPQLALVNAAPWPDGEYGTHVRQFFADAVLSGNPWLTAAAGPSGSVEFWHAAQPGQVEDANYGSMTGSFDRFRAGVVRIAATDPFFRDRLEARTVDGGATLVCRFQLT